ncbi:unnamed protein product [Chrysoparadoxa australica]
MHGPDYLSTREEVAEEMLNQRMQPLFTAFRNSGVRLKKWQGIKWASRVFPLMRVLGTSPEGSSAKRLKGLAALNPEQLSFVESNVIAITTARYLRKHSLYDPARHSLAVMRLLYCAMTREGESLHSKAALSRYASLSVAELGGILDPLQKATALRRTKLFALLMPQEAAAVKRAGGDMSGFKLDRLLGLCHQVQQHPSCEDTPRQRSVPRSLLEYPNLGVWVLEEEIERARAVRGDGKTVLVRNLLTFRLNDAVRIFRIPRNLARYLGGITEGPCTKGMACKHATGYKAKKDAVMRFMFLHVDKQPSRVEDSRVPITLVVVLESSCHRKCGDRVPVFPADEAGPGIVFTHPEMLASQLFPRLQANLRGPLVNPEYHRREKRVTIGGEKVSTKTLCLKGPGENQKFEHLGSSMPRHERALKKRQDEQQRQGNQEEGDGEDSVDLVKLLWGSDAEVLDSDESDSDESEPDD